jgi:LSD1 subclass zinc finger protein
VYTGGGPKARLISFPRGVAPVLLTCPTCQTGLQIPDGTTAMVRCPTCRTIFSPADSPAPPAVAPAPPPEDTTPPAPPRAKKRVDAEADDRPRRKTRPRDEDDRPRRKRRDEEPDEEEEERPRRKAEPEDGLTPEGRRRQKAAFQRAMWGCRLVYWSLLLYILSMVVVILFFMMTATAAGEVPALLSVAGVLCLANWVLGAVGIGLCVSGPKSPGHVGYGIAAAVAAGVHLIFVLATLDRGDAFAEFKKLETEADALAGFSTKLVKLGMYGVWLAYPSEGFTPRQAPLFVVCGAAEMLRLILLTTLLSCLARAGGDEELSHKCVRAAAVAVFVPGALVFGMLGVVSFVIETGAEGSSMGKIILETTRMGAYALLAGMLVPPSVAARDVADVCEAPFQKPVNLAG